MKNSLTKTENMIYFTIRHWKSGQKTSYERMYCEKIHVIKYPQLKKNTPYIFVSNHGFRTISGNPRQFNYRDESAGVCMSAH